MLTKAADDMWVALRRRSVGRAGSSCARCRGWPPGRGVGLVDVQQSDRLGAVRGRSDEISVGGRIGREERPSGVVLVCEQDRLIALGYVCGTSLEVVLTLFSGTAARAQRATHARGREGRSRTSPLIGADCVLSRCNRASGAPAARCQSTVIGCCGAVLGPPSVGTRGAGALRVVQRSDAKRGRGVGRSATERSSLVACGLGLPPLAGC